MEFRPSNNLRSRTFTGLLIAQFLAAFNDQAIHASAMFFAFHKHLLNEAQAISLMPILFYAPWAIFVTLAGYLADRYSKRDSLVFWKFAEIGICSVALIGFALGSHGHGKIGPILVLACVFLMGMHSTFFVPAKYGAMPEILEPQILSRGNGALESLSFLAVILGTVCGGLLSFVLRGHETWIGVIFLTLAVIGALSSLLIEKMPAANPQRQFPPYLYGPLAQSLKTLLSARPLALAAVGIAFFTFVVVYMRGSVYMLGESQSPRWNEFKTSIVVGFTALGIGIGSPLAGWLSGRKIELGLVPIGGIGMVLVALFATASLGWLPGLIVGVILIGFCAGFYLVPLYTLLQHRAPKLSKGDMVATSNFINVIGAMVASILFFALVSSFQSLGYAPLVPFVDGPLVKVHPRFEEGRLVDFEGPGGLKPVTGKKEIRAHPSILPVHRDELIELHIDQVQYKGVEWYYLRPDGEARVPTHDNSGLPRFLFLGAAGITGFILVVLFFIMPDLHKRAIFAFQTLAGPRLRTINTHFVPLTGETILATNCRTVTSCRQLRSATDRLIFFVGPLADMATANREELIRIAKEQLGRGQVVGVAEEALDIIGQLHTVGPVIPVYVGPPTGDAKPSTRDVLVAFGPALPARPDTNAISTAIREAAVAPEEFGAH
ncbi:MAG: MFS transporter [Gemmataceae bacterium]